MSWFATKLISAFLLPPLNLLLLSVAGWMLWHKRPLLARMLLVISLGLLWLLSTPFVAEALLHTLEGKPYALNPHDSEAQAIVVLGGGTYFHAPEYGGDTVSSQTLERLRYAAKLQRETGKPVLVTGGRPLGNAISEAEQMKRVMEEAFGVPIRWTEAHSDNTAENARFSKEILAKVGIQRIYLVTHAWHMPRARLVFQRAGLEVVPAPTGWTTRYRLDLLAFLPSARGLWDSRTFMHEWIGLFWYHLAALFSADHKEVSHESTHQMG